MTVHTGTPGGTGERPADVAAQETSRVTGEAAAQARDLAGQFRTQASTQADQQKGRAVEQLRSLGDGLQNMAQGGGPGPAQDLVQELAVRARGLSDYVDSRDPSQLIDDLRGVARRRPVAFLAGAAIAGAVLGRLSRGVFSAATGGGSPDRSTSPGYDSYGYGYAPASEVAASTVSPHGVSTGATAAGAGTTAVGVAGTGAAGTTTTTTGPSDAILDDATLGPLGPTTEREEDRRASGTEGSFHG